MRFSYFLLPLAFIAAIALAIGPALADPRKPPDTKTAIISQSGILPAMIKDIILSNVSHERDGLTASYFANFQFSVTGPEATFTKISEGDGYVVIEPVMTNDGTFTVSGNVLGFYSEGAWQTQVNLLERRHPGGQPYRNFQSPDHVILMAGEADLDAFLARRSEAKALAHTMAMQDIETEAVETRRRKELEAEQAAADIRAQAAADEIKRQYDRKAEAALIAEREKADNMIMALFSEGAELPAEVAHAGKRLTGKFTIGRVADTLVEGTAVFDTGNGGSYTMGFNIHLTGDAGYLNLVSPKLYGFRPNNDTCQVTATPNIEGGFIRFTNSERHCEYEFLIEGLGIKEK